jgi:hypothetical protein
VGRFLFGAVALLMAWAALGAADAPRVRVVLGIEAAILAALVAAVQLVFLPRVRREQAELDGLERP